MRETFSDLHETIVRLSDETAEVGDEALGLRHHSSSRSYRHVEEIWSDVRRKADPALDILAYVPISLDSLPARNEKKAAALALSVSYRSALEHFIDYTHYAVLYERAENALAMDNRPLAQTFSIGVNEASMRSGDDTFTRGMLDANVTEVRDAMRGLLYPEYRYDKVCHGGNLPIRRQAASRRSWADG